jgi:hypothetical protein
VLIEATATMQSLPSRGQLFVFAVLLPAFVAGTNQLLFEIVPTFPGVRIALYPWMALSTAVLGWCVGRYLSPAWLRWLVFGWCLVLLDFLTIAACMSGRVENHFGYALVSAQIGLIVLWAILAQVHWQSRLPTVLVAAAAVTVFSGSFEDQWNARNWNLLMIVTAIVISLICTTLRWRGFALRRTDHEMLDPGQRASLGTHQFGLRHMLIWATVLGPILLVARGLDFVLLKRLGAPDLFPFVLLALGVATVNLLAIWTVLGDGRFALRVAALLAIPLLLAFGIGRYLEYVESTYRRISTPGQRYMTWTNNWYDSLINGIVDAREALLSWFWLDAALLAALLLFFRASRYHLMQTSRQD